MTISQSISQLIEILGHDLFESDLSALSRTDLERVEHLLEHWQAVAYGRLMAHGRRDLASVDEASE